MGATAAVGISGAGNAFMQAEQGRATRSASRFNAHMLRLQAGDALERGRFQETQLRKKIGDIKATQRSGYAAQGVDVDSGTAAAVQQETSEIGELDALMIRNNAAKEAQGLRTGAILEEGRGRAASRLAKASAGLTMATAGSDAFSTYRKMNPK